MVVETRYLDLDYRSEFSAYYSRQFSNVPDSAHRIHFFGKQLSSDSLWDSATQSDYIGYVVVRPVGTGLVSRAMLPPPPDLEGAVRTSVKEQVNFFGQKLEVWGVPFAQQDAQLGACAQAAAWMCHITAHLRGETTRRAKADFSLHADASLQPHQAMPSRGLTAIQLSDLFRTFNLPAMYYSVGELPSPGFASRPPGAAAPARRALQSSSPGSPRGRCGPGQPSSPTSGPLPPDRERPALPSDHRPTPTPPRRP